MNSLAVAGFMIGLIFFYMFVNFEPSVREENTSVAYAKNFVFYRNAVNLEALKGKTPGKVSLPPNTLPAGLILQKFKNQVVDIDGKLHCFVYSTASINDFSAVQTLLKGSAAIGWNNHGVMMRNGVPFSLPAFIPTGNIVSVIIIE